MLHTVPMISYAEEGVDSAHNGTTVVESKETSGSEEKDEDPGKMEQSGERQGTVAESEQTEQEQTGESVEAELERTGQEEIEQPGDDIEHEEKDEESGKPEIVEGSESEKAEEDQLDTESELLTAFDATGDVVEYQPDGVSYKLTYTDVTDGVKITGITGTKEGELKIPAKIDGKDVVEIEDYAFSSCRELTGNLVIPDSLTSIGKYAFNGCDGLTGKLILPKNMTKITSYAFAGSGIREVDFSKITEIEEGGFSNCSGLTDIVISENVTAIGDKAFLRTKSGAYKLTLKSRNVAIGAQGLGYNSFIYGYSGSTAEAYVADSANQCLFFSVDSTKEHGIEECRVSTTEELMAALGSYKRIILADGVYRIVEEYEKGSNEIWWNHVSDTGTLILKNLNSVSIEAEHPGRAEILSRVDEAYTTVNPNAGSTVPVVEISGCKNIKIEGCILGHESELAGCDYGANVVNIVGSCNINLFECDLFGCGYIGICCNGAENVNVNKCVIRDCKANILDGYGAKNFRFTDCILSGHRGVKAALSCEGDVYFGSCKFLNNNNTSFDKYGNVDTGDDCVFYNNSWRGENIEKSGICLNGITWQIDYEYDEDYNYVLVLKLGYPLKFKTGTIYSEKGTVLDYSDASKPWKGIKYDKIRYYDGFEPSDSVESIKLDKDTLTLSVGATAMLTVEITPNNAAASVTWSSSDISIAKVEDGLVTAVSDGACTITASAENKSAVCNVKVTSNPSKDDIANGSYENVKWRIDNNGKLTVEGTGDFADSKYAYSSDRVPWSAYKGSITSAEINLKDVVNTSFMFYGCENLVNVDMKQLDTSNVTNMSWMFHGCSNLANVDVSNFDTEKVKDMSLMFDDCSSLTNVDVSGFDTRNVLDMEGMFGGCNSLASVDVSGFDTGNATDMRFMFYGCSSLIDVDVSGFDTGKVMDMDRMFEGCRNLVSLDLSSFDMGNVKEADFFISGCDSLTSIYVPRNCHIDGLKLPDSQGTWHDYNGNEYSNLPMDREETILLVSKDYTGQPVEKITARKTQTIYHCGDAISTDDIIVMHYTKDGTVKKVLNFTTNVSDIDMTTPGKKALIISYIPENGNETATLTASVTITVTYPGVKISGIEIKDSVYNKAPVFYTGTTKVTSETDNTDLTNTVKLTYTYSGIQADGSVYAATNTAPVNAGSYKLTVAATQEDQTCVGSVEYSFKIAKAPLTITARDIGLKIGAELPKVEDYRYDIIGLLEGDKLTKEPEFACSIVSTAESGTYEITVSGADAGMNYEITYKNGILAVNENGEIAKYYTVTFKLSGKGSDIVNTGVKEGSFLEKPQDPQAKGYTFKGWYKDLSCTDKWDFAKDTIQSDITLYAGWTKKDEGGDDNKDDSQYTDEERADLSSAAIASIKAKTYDGNAYEPAVKVKVKSGGKTITLIEGTDYRVLYNNNVNAGQNAEVIIKGNGIYKGSLSKKYTIIPKSVKKLKIVTGGMSNMITVSESNLSNLPVYVYDGTKLLKYNTDYTLSNYSTSKSTAKVVVTGAGNYTGAAVAKITLYSVDNDRIINSENVSLVTDTVPYTGKAVKNIEPTVTVGTTTLTKNKDYKVQYTNNTNAGTAFVIITGKGTYKGRVVKPFTIKAATVTSEQVTIKPISAKTYNRKLQKPAVTVTVPNGTKTKKLTKNKDYSITYKNNLHVGKATVVITGRGNYKGMEARAEFTINPQKISKASVKGTQGNITLMYAGRALREGSDYETPIYGEVKNNKIKVIIKGKGDFAGEMTKNVKIQ